MQLKNLIYYGILFFVDQLENAASGTYWNRIRKFKIINRKQNVNMLTQYGTK